MTSDFIKVGDQILKELLSQNGHGEIGANFRSDLSGNIIYQTINQLEDNNLLLIVSGSIILELRLTPIGFKAARSGLQNYFDECDKQEKIDLLAKELNLKKLKFYDRVKWWPLVISILSLIGTIIALFFNHLKRIS